MRERLPLHVPLHAHELVVVISQLLDWSTRLRRFISNSLSRGAATLCNLSLQLQHLHVPHDLPSMQNFKDTHVLQVVITQFTQRGAIDLSSAEDGGVGELQTSSHEIRHIVNRPLVHALLPVIAISGRIFALDLLPGAGDAARFADSSSLELQK